MKKLKKQTKQLAAGTLGLGMGSIALGGVGGSVAAQGQAGLSNISSYVPTMGKVMAAGGLCRAIGSLSPKKKRRK